MYIALDIGGTKTSVAASTKLDVERHVEFRTPPRYSDAIIQIEDHIRNLTNEPIAGIGVAAPDPDRQKGIITVPKNMPWRNVPIVADLSKRFGCPVALDNDASLGGITEARYGAGANFNIVLYITISTLIGSAIIVNKELLPTRYNSEGGKQFIHSEGKLSMFEDEASGSAIIRKYGRVAKDITDPKIWDEIAGVMAIGIHNMIMITAPDCVVLGGGVSNHFMRFAPLLKQKLDILQQVFPTPPILQAKFVNTAPLLGAMWLAHQTT